jgi:hypothetical protein
MQGGISGQSPSFLHELIKNSAVTMAVIPARVLPPIIEE